MKEQENSDYSKLTSLRRACFCVVFFYAFLLLLNGKGIYEEIAKQAYGAHRDFLLQVTRPLAILSEKTHACAIRDTVKDTVGIWLNGTD